MKTILYSLMTMAALGFTASAQAADAASAPSTQQSKMATCNKEATDKKGDERKAFMKDCLSAKAEATAAASAPTGQPSRMKTCNDEAKGKTGDERKVFMKTCLSNKS